MAQPDAAQESLIEPAYVLACMRRLLPTEEGGADSGVADDAAREEADADLIDAGCTVWDLAANVELAAFMCEHGLPVLLLRPIRAHESHSIRLVEVCVGALANLVGSEQLLRALETALHVVADEARKLRTRFSMLEATRLTARAIHATYSEHEKEHAREQAENAALRGLLIDLHAQLETQSGEAAETLVEAIWDELVRSTERRRLSMASF